MQDVTGGVSQQPGNREKADIANALSIVVQGPLGTHNLLGTARTVQHWRTLFPVAQIVLSLSETDLFEHDASGRPIVGVTSLVQTHLKNSLIRRSVEVIVSNTSAIVHAEPSLPLPALKGDEVFNNANLQIAAAQAGPAVATGEYSLRIRSDMLFVDDSFVDFYLENYAVARRFPKIFFDRVMISSLFTLNPFTVERMPFHFGDFFHFGRTKDVAKIWDVTPVPLADSTYYLFSPYPAFANYRERAIQYRRAVEQHIHFFLAKRSYPDARLDYHLDWTSRDLAMRILADEFLICDMDRCKFMAGRFERHRDHPILCLSYSDWKQIVAAPQGFDFVAHYADRLSSAQAIVNLSAKAGRSPTVRRAFITVTRWLAKRIPF